MTRPSICSGLELCNKENLPKLINSPVSWAWRKELGKIGNNIFNSRGNVSLSVRGRLQSQPAPLWVLCYKLTCVKIYIKKAQFLSWGENSNILKQGKKEKKHSWSSFSSSTCKHLHSPKCSAIPQREAFTAMDFYRRKFLSFQKKRIRCKVWTHRSQTGTSKPWSFYLSKAALPWPFPSEPCIKRIFSQFFLGSFQDQAGDSPEQAWETSEHRRDLPSSLAPQITPNHPIMLRFGFLRELWVFSLVKRP